MLTTPLRYDNYTDARQRLNKSIVRLDGEPVYIQQVNDDLHVSCLRLLQWSGNEREDVPEVTIHSSDIRLDIESPELGWANAAPKGNKKPVYFLRTIARQFCQGIVPAKACWIDPSKATDVLQQGWLFRSFNDIVPMMRSIANTGYPSIVTAVTLPNGGAIDREWALLPTKSEKVFTLYHEFKAVGYFSLKDRRFYFGQGHLTKLRRMSLDRIIHNNANRSTVFGLEELS